MTENKNITTQKEEPDLYKRSIKGSYWVIVTQLAISLLGFSKTLFIANFFLLNDLGIISIALMMMEILNTFTQTGFDTALIQKKGNIHDYLDTAWTAGIVKGILLFMILFFTAPLLASLRIPEDKLSLAIWVFRAMSSCFLITGFRNIGAIYFSKNMEFHKTFTLTVASTLTDIVLSVALIWIFHSIWGVIVARLVSACIACVGTYFLSSYRPRLHFESAKARELWKFGRWILGGQALGYILDEGDDFFVWAYLGLPSLALYRYAYRLAYLPTTHITNIISRVTFPAYSKIQNDLPRLQDAYFKILTATAIIGVPSAFLIFTFGPDFVHLLLPERMYPMTLALQIFALKGFMGTIGATRMPIFNALEKASYILYLSIAKLGLLLILIYPLTYKWGINGTAAAIVLMNLIINPIGFLLSCRLLACSKWTMLKPILIPTIVSCFMSLIIITAKHLFVSNMNLILLCGFICISMVIYLLILWPFDAYFDCGIRSIIYEFRDHFLKSMNLKLLRFFNNKE